MHVIIIMTARHERSCVYQRECESVCVRASVLGVYADGGRGSLSVN